MRYLLRISPVCIVMLALALLTGCDAAHIDTLDPAAEENANIDQLTEETLREVEQLTRTYDNILSEAGKSRRFAYVPAGSNNALAVALAQVGSRGVVVLASGDHYESATVAITQRVALVGAPGARLIVDTKPMPTVATMDPALHVTDASHVVIWGLEMVPQGDVGGTGILAERAPHLVVGRNTIREHQIGVAVDQTDHVRIIHNTLEIAPTPVSVPGMVVISGARAMVVSNAVSHANGPGIFVSDKKGKLIRNELFSNFVGILLCTVPGLPAPSGDILAAEVSATEWLINLNDAHDNGGWGYLFIDGTNKNLMAPTNRGSNNALYDIELAGDTNRFGFFSPFSFENTVLVGDAGMTVKDCGVNNKVHGGTVVDTGADPCF